MDRPEIVFILGSGASVPSGCPTLANFFPTMYLHASSNNDPTFQRDVRALIEFQSDLKNTSRCSRIGSMNIEEVLSLLDMSISLGIGFGRHTLKDLESLRQAAARAIRATIVYSQQFYCEASYKQITPGGDDLVLDNESQPKFWCRGYDHVAREVAQRLYSNAHVKFTFITLNYDTGLETCLKSARLLPDDYLGTNGDLAEDPGHQRVSVYKLHGSVNLVKCLGGEPSSVFKEVRVHEFLPRDTLHIVRNSIRKPRQSPLPPDGRALYRLRVRHDPMRITSHNDETPHIISPSDNKLTQIQYRRPEWKLAASSISNASVICFVGYSFPPTDAHFRRFIALSIAVNSKLTGVFAVDTCPDDILKARISELIDPDLLWLTDGSICSLKLPDSSDSAGCEDEIVDMPRPSLVVPGDFGDRRTLSPFWNRLDKTNNLYGGLTREW